MASYLVCWHDREDRACVTHGCKCCSATCCAGNWALCFSGVWTVVGVVFAVWWISALSTMSQTMSFSTLEYFAFIMLACRSFFVALVHAAIAVTLCVLRGTARRHVTAKLRVGTALHRKLVVIFSVLLAVNGAWVVGNGITYIFQRAASTRPAVMPQWARVVLEVFVFVMNGLLIVAIFVHLEAASKAVAQNERAERAAQRGDAVRDEVVGGVGGALPYNPPIVDAVVVEETLQERGDGGPAGARGRQELAAPAPPAAPPRAATDG